MRYKVEWVSNVTKSGFVHVEYFDSESLAIIFRNGMMRNDNVVTVSPVQRVQ